jgi:signal transduction histidine kinase
MADRILSRQERYDLSRFDLSHMIRFGRRLRVVAEPGACMEDAAQRVVEYLRESLVEGDEGKPGCALVRCFKTHPLGKLSPELAQIAVSSLQGAQPHPELPCLTLLATSGEEPEWNSRQSSRGHRAIPLERAEVFERAPMIGRLIQQMGLRPDDVIQPSPDFLLDAEQRAFNVFHVPEAQGSRYVPAQGFVEQYGIRSVLGFGGLMPSGELFALILFSRVPISREVADMFRTIALSTKLVLLPFTRGPVFREEIGQAFPQTNATAQERQRAEIATLQLLIPALEDVALQQTEKLKRAVYEAQQRTEEVRELNAVLERRVEERTAELVTTNEELKAFSFSVSHDLRAPLRTIDGFSAALQEDYAELLDETGRNYLRRIQAGVGQMNLLIDAMMRLSRVTRAELVRSTVSLSTAAEAIAAELRERDPSRKVHFDIEPGLIAEADTHLVKVLLENLLGNAFKFTSRRDAALIRMGWSEAQKAFFVQDNGAGFDMQYADKLFRSFSRLHTVQEFEGSGVGLATVARIVRRHGGTLWAEGAVGQGATFWFQLR